MSLATFLLIPLATGLVQLFPADAKEWPTKHQAVAALVMVFANVVNTFKAWQSQTLARYQEGPR
jgi:hypothetical protein